ncbi:MAG: DUF1572 family protein [Theionarchaea archaeon]|nr:DUF1572 family protein [Theionarchaea archaeon]
MDYFRNEYLKDVLNRFRRLKELTEKALDQVSDEAFFAVLDSDENSIAILVKHMTGNMLSRWTDFLTTDGEKPHRDRDGEFQMDSATTRADLVETWEKGWDTLLGTIESLRPEDLEVVVYIRRNPCTVSEAINRQLIHYALHVGQIIMLAKHFSHTWKTLSIPRSS